MKTPVLDPSCGRAAALSGALALALVGCASTTYRGYPDGGLKFSNVRYDYTAQPKLRDASGLSYSVETDAALAGVGQIGALEARGMKRVPSGGDVVVRISGGAIRQEPGSFGLGGSYKPALLVELPVQIDIRGAAGEALLERRFVHEEALGLPGAKSFPSREEAKAAMASVTAFTGDGAETKARTGAAREVQSIMKLAAKDLFEPRQVAVTLPAVRSAGDVDMEAAYTLLAAAETPDQVDAALAAYEGLEREPTRADGSPDVVGKYGILVGTASARVLSGDLPGAWAATKAAWDTYPQGQEHGLVGRVLIQQQKESGVKFIPDEDMERMQPKNALEEAIRRLQSKSKK